MAQKTVTGPTPEELRRASEAAFKRQQEEQQARQRAVDDAQQGKTTSALGARTGKGRQVVEGAGVKTVGAGVVVQQGQPKSTESTPLAKPKEGGEQHGALNGEQIADLMHEEEIYLERFRGSQESKARKAIKKGEIKLEPGEDMNQKSNQIAGEKADDLKKRCDGADASAQFVDGELNNFFDQRMKREESTGATSERAAAAREAREKREAAVKALEGGARMDDTIEIGGQKRKVSEVLTDVLQAEARAVIDNPDSRKLAEGEMAACVKLFQQAQTDGDIPKDVPASQVLKLMEQQLKAVAFQDSVAHGNTNGDHGMRHIAYDISMFDQQMDGLAKRGQEVKAVDRLMGHMSLQLHDLGYANKTVREGIEAGKFGIDNGHNMFAARYVREAASDSSNPMARIFSADQIDIMHEAVLTHDYSEGNLKAERSLNPEEQRSIRVGNIISAVRNADNTHAFEDKLPEVLYSTKESLRFMRLAKTIGEAYSHVDSKDHTSPEALERDRLMGQVRKGLVRAIEANDQWSPEERQGLVKAAMSIQPDSYKFNVGRICGNQPTMTIGETGKLEVTVQESAIHQEVVQLFGMDSHKQLVKFCADLSGRKEEDVIAAMREGKPIEGPGVIIKTATGEKGRAAGEETDYQRAVRTLINDKGFQDFAVRDNGLGGEQSRLEAALKTEGQEGVEKRKAAAAQLLREERDSRTDDQILAASGRTPDEVIKGAIADLKKQRIELLKQQMGGVPAG